MFCNIAQIGTPLTCSGTSLFRTLWDLKISPYYRVFLNSEVIIYTTVLDWDTNGVLIIEVSTDQRFLIERLHCNTMFRLCVRDCKNYREIYTLQNIYIKLAI